MFPVTRLSYTNSTENPKLSRFRTAANKRFYEVTSYMITLFYIWAKWFMGIGFNYLWHSGSISEFDMSRWGWPLFLLNTGTVSLAVFLHTLRFKSKLSPRLAHGIYILLAYFSFLAVPPLFAKFMETPHIAAIVWVGAGVNSLRSKTAMHIYFVIAAIMLT